MSEDPTFVRRVRHSVRNAALAALTLAALGGLPAWPSTVDRSGPNVRVIQPRGGGDEEVLRIRARITDPSGVDSATLFVRGAQDARFKPVGMERETEWIWFAVLPSWPTQGERIAYYVEAVDLEGNGPSSAGSDIAPFELTVGRTKEADAVPPGHVAALVLLGVVLALGGIGHVVSRREARLESRRRDVEFWRHRFEPLLDVPAGRQRDRMIDAFCKRTHHHPTLGPVALDRESVVRRLAAMTDGRRRTKTSPKEVPLKRSENPVECVEEEIFWFRLLAPLRGMDIRDREKIFAQLASRPHHHPIHGKQIIDRNTLRREFHQTLTTTMEDLLGRWRTVKLEAAEQSKEAVADGSTDGTRSEKEEEARSASAETSQESLGTEDAPPESPSGADTGRKSKSRSKRRRRSRSRSRSKSKSRANAEGKASKAKTHSTAREDETPKSSKPEEQAKASDSGRQETAASPWDDTPESIAEEMFWYNLLAPFRELPVAERNAAIAKLSGQAHRHPVKGHRLFSARRLQQEFEWVRCVDLDQLHEKWNRAAFAAIEAITGSAGGDFEAAASLDDSVANLEFIGEMALEQEEVLAMLDESLVSKPVAPMGDDAGEGDGDRESAS